MTNSKLYVGNLNFNASENGLREIFSEAGEVRETAIIIDKTTNPAASPSSQWPMKPGRKEPARSSKIATFWGASSL
jgi:RNA recognition motif-containing protein